MSISFLFFKNPLLWSLYINDRSNHLGIGIELIKIFNFHKTNILKLPRGERYNSKSTYSTLPLASKGSLPKATAKEAKELKGDSELLNEKWKTISFNSEIYNIFKNLKLLNIYIYIYLVVGRKGPNQFSHRLALEHITFNSEIYNIFKNLKLLNIYIYIYLVDSKKPVNCKIINDILSYCNITINDEILKNLINSPRIIINNLDKEKSKKIITNNLGLPSSKIKIPGVYIFTHKITGNKYVGSSSQLSFRLNCYLNNKYKTIGKIIPLLNKESFFNFTLEIIPLFNNYSFRS
jgi:GIY-YIG catalytic domain